MITSDWVDILRCSRCGAPYESSGDALTCRGCNTRFPVVEHIPLLITDTTIGTALEHVDYDQAHGVNDQLIRDTGAEWNEIITRLGLRTERVLEIGAGTGVLTLGLMQEGGVGQVVATDVSHKFLRNLARRAAPLAAPLALVACDASEPHFRHDVFDLVVGRSILHHLLDYDVTLRQSCSMLKPGGAAIFLEPVLDGKTLVTVMLALVVAIDEKASDPVLSPEEREVIRKQIRHQMKSRRGPQDRQTLSRREDKYIFEIEKMRDVAREAGFGAFEFVTRTRTDPNYWLNVVQTARNIGVPAEKLREYRWVGDQFTEIYGVMFPDWLVPPMGYFVFRKAAEGSGRTQSAVPAKSARPAIRTPEALRSVSTQVLSSGRVPVARIVGILARGGISVRGASQLQVRDRNSDAQQRALVFVVPFNGGRYLVSPDSKARWARNLRAAGAGALRVGRRVEQIRVTRATQDVDPEVFDRWQNQTRSLGIARTPADGAYWLVFRIEPGSGAATSPGAKSSADD